MTVNTSRKYSATEVCKRFDIPRTTLFRWEDVDKKVPLTRRGANGERIYEPEHLLAVADQVRERVNHEFDVAVRSNDYGEVSPEPYCERLYVAQFFGGPDKETGLAHLRGLALQGKLSSKLVHLLIEDALSRPKGDCIRNKVWKLMLENDENAK
jgi:hypothetical protein